MRFINDFLATLIASGTAAAVLLGSMAPGHAQQAAPPQPSDDEFTASTCIAIADNMRHSNPDFPVQFASLAGTVSSRLDDEVKISFSGHSTYVIDTPGGVRIATDFQGFLSARVGSTLPTVATMNNAHSSLFTLVLPAGIKHILHGWNDDGVSPNRHALTVEDTYVRNVTTDILRWGVARQNQNSIFIFEVAGLCIGHLGHLHHRLTENHFASIGRLDIVMVPIDGGLTMGLAGMKATLDRLKSRIVLPMHRRGNPLTAFTSMLGDDFAVEFHSETTLTVTARTLPKRPPVLVLPGV